MRTAIRGPARRRPLSLPAAAMLAFAGTMVSCFAIAWAVKAALNVG